MNVEEPKHETVSTPNNWGARSEIQSLVLLVATFGGIYICYLLALPFLSALTWALVLAVLCASAHWAIEVKLRRPNLSATISVLMVALIIVVPATFIVERLISEAAKGATVIQAQVQGGAWRSAIDAHPWIAPIDKWIEQQIDLLAIFGNVASWLTNTGASFVRGSVVQLLGVVFTFYLLFYFLRDRRLVLETLRTLSPLSQVEMDRLFSQIVDTVHATIYGTVVVAGVQGTLGGLMFWWLGLPTPLLWGLVMALLAVVPVLGVHRLDPSGNLSGARRQLGEGHNPRFVGCAGRRWHRQLLVSDAGGKPSQTPHRPSVHFFGRRSGAVWPGRYYPGAYGGHNHNDAS